MNIKRKVNEKELTIIAEGRIDTNTAPLLENEITDIEKFKNLIFDFKDVEYISSAGLRVLLTAQKRINKVGGNMKISNVSENVKDVFEVTGFTDILKIE